MKCQLCKKKDLVKFNETLQKCNYFLFISGLFNHGHMAYEVDREPGPEGEPSLAEMTRKAIEILRKNSQGYFLMVEGKTQKRKIITKLQNEKVF